MIVKGNAILLGQDSYTSKKNGNTYLSAILVDDNNKQVKMNIEKPLGLEFTRFCEVEFKADLNMGLTFASLNLIELKLLKK